MILLAFEPAAEQHKNTGIELAKSPNPDFEAAREELQLALTIQGQNSEHLTYEIYNGRIANDLGVVSVREGLRTSQDESGFSELATGHVDVGIELIDSSYESLMNILLHSRREVGVRGWEPSLHAHIGATMNTLFRAVQTRQIMRGQIGPRKKADQDAIEEQWMLGEGREHVASAWDHVRQSDNGYWSTQTAFLGVRGERINGGADRFREAVRWFVRGLPEMSRRIVTDPTNRKQIVLTSGRLTLEALSRNRAIAAALNYRTF